jgi:aconitase A
MSTVVPTISGPKRPQDKVLLTDAPTSFKKVLEEATNKKITLFQKFQILIMKLKMVQF